MPEQLPKEIFNMISDRSSQLNCIEDYTYAIQLCLGKVPSYILADLIDSVRCFNRSVESLELELRNNGYSFDQFAYLTAIVDAAEKDKSRAGGGGNTVKTLGIYIWYFFAESEIFPKILIAVSLVIFGMFLERAW
jgi:hypothetical protein